MREGVTLSAAARPSLFRREALRTRNARPYGHKPIAFPRRGGHWPPADIGNHRKEKNVVLAAATATCFVYFVISEWTDCEELQFAAAFSRFSTAFTCIWQGNVLNYLCNTASYYTFESVFLLFGKNVRSFLAFSYLCQKLCCSNRSCAFFGAQLRLRTFYVLEETT